MRIRIIQPPLVQPRYRQLTLPVVGAEFAKAGMDVETCDENVEALDLSSVDLVGITCHVYNARRAFEIARGFRERGVPVLLGGTFPTVAPELAAPHCDSVVVGELEGQTAQIADDARAGKLKPFYRAALPPSLATTVAPDWSLLRADRYLRFNFPLELSRGCRFACRFCTSNLLFPSPRTRSLRDIERDLARWDHGLVEVVDVNFLHDARFFEGVLPLLTRAPGPGWTGQTTVADLAANPSWPDQLARSRCRAVFVGLESISHEGLRSINKSWSKPQVFLDVAQRLRDAGVLVQAGIVVGLDSDEPGVLARTADFLEEARVQSVSFTWLHYYPGTAPFELAQREGRLLSTDWRDYDGNRPVIRPARMEVAQLQEELAAMCKRLYSLSSIGRRAWHRGMSRESAQVLHHLFVNSAMRAYYSAVKAGSDTMGGDRLRYMGGRRRQDRGEKLAADASSWLLDRLMGTR